MSNIYAFPKSNLAMEYGGGAPEADIALLKYFDLPSLLADELWFNGNEQSPQVVNFDSDFMTVTGTTSATEPGDYHVTVGFKSKKYCRWPDGTSDDIILPWTLHNVRQFAKPTLNKTSFSYNGSAQGPTISGVDSEFMTVTGTQSTAATEGTFKITVAFKDKDYCRWQDGTNNDVVLTWTVVDNRTVINNSYDILQISCNKRYYDQYGNEFAAGTVGTPFNGHYHFKKSDLPATITVKVPTTWWVILNVGSWPQNYVTDYVTISDDKKTVTATVNQTTIEMGADLQFQMTAQYPTMQKVADSRLYILRQYYVDS